MFNSIKARLKSLKKQGKYGAGYVDTVVKVITCVVVGALLLTGIYAIANTGMTTASNKTDSLFSYEAELPGGPGGAGGGGALPDGEDSEGVTMLDGAGQSHNRATPKALSFRSSAPIDTFEKVIIDGVEIDSNCYTLESGSTRVIFKDIFAKSLTDGEHNIEIVSADGTATADFTVTMTPGVYDADWNLVHTWDEFITTVEDYADSEDLPILITEREFAKSTGAPEEALPDIDDTVACFFTDQSKAFAEISNVGIYKNCNLVLKSFNVPVEGSSVTAFNGQSIYLCTGALENSPFKSIINLGGGSYDGDSLKNSECETIYMMTPFGGGIETMFSNSNIKELYFNGTKQDFMDWYWYDYTEGEPLLYPNSLTVHCLDGDMQSR